jgi:hypothetical protein
LPVRSPTIVAATPALPLFAAGSSERVLVARKASFAEQASVVEQAAVVAESASAADSAVVVAAAVEESAAAVASVGAVEEQVSAPASVEEQASSQAVDSDWAWLSVESVSPASVGELEAGRSRACYSDPTADDWPAVEPAWADDNSVGDSANCRHIRGDCYKESVEADTRHVADDKGFAIPPRRCDCSSTGAMSNSIPIPSIPTGGCSQTESQVESAARNSQPQHWWAA